jgi:hypothetical protein
LAEEASLPEEERDRIHRIRDADALKNQGNEFYKKKDF